MSRAAELSKAEVAKSTEAGAALMKRTILAGAPARLRNFGKNGSPLSVGYNVGHYEDGAKALVYARGKGWPIIERDTRPHPIPRLSGARSKTLYGPAFGGVNKRRKRPVVVGGHPYAQVFHPGTKGQHLFEHGVDKAIPLISLQYAARQAAVLRTVF